MHAPTMTDWDISSQHPMNIFWPQLFEDCKTLAIHWITQYQVDSYSC